MLTFLIPMSTKKNLKKDLLFPIIVIVLSIANLIQQFNSFSIISTFTSVIGIAGAVFFFLGSGKYKLLFYLWILFQLFVVKVAYDDYNIGARVVRVMWEAIQGDLAFYFSLTFNGFSVQLNVVAIFYLVLFRALKVSELKGIELTFSKLKAESHFGDDLPVKGVVIDILKIGGEKEWLLVQLSNFIHNGDTEINTVLVKRKDGEVIEKNREGQIVYFRLVENINEIYTAERISQFPLIEWVLCK